ncbi:hypothetical protein Gogos_003771 [Gossypium gossypioides]|uniref:Cytochrome P450 n=1 Tax=Gossypium gossypioides TaxID=34282 RepID=A0A7J9CNW3_GOSGO|nr:hypothetical protein [Gossypium gossypioides]
MMAELLKHPNAMKKVQEEVKNVVGNKSKVDMEDISKMEYLKCVIKETYFKIASGSSSSSSSTNICECQIGRLPHSFRYHGLD